MGAGGHDCILALKGCSEGVDGMVVGGNDLGVGRQDALGLCRIPGENRNVELAAFLESFENGRSEVAGGLRA